MWCLAAVLLAVVVSGCNRSQAGERIVASTSPVPTLARTSPVDASTPPGLPEAAAEPGAAGPGEAASLAEAGTSDWCREGFAAFEDDGCYLIPPDLRQPKALLIYLHGVIAPGGDTQKIVQGIVARQARAHGYVAFMPKGRRGIGPPPVQDWWSWPTTHETHLRYAHAMVANWLEKKRRLESMTGGSFGRTYVAGSSNGAFFAAILALNGEIDTDGFGAMSGGSRAGKTKSTIRATRFPKFYVGYGVQDDLKPHPISLGQLLEEAAWPHMVREHNTGHGAREVYLDEAFAYWSEP